MRSAERRGNGRRGVEEPTRQFPGRGGEGRGSGRAGTRQRRRAAVPGLRQHATRFPRLRPAGLRRVLLGVRHAPARSDRKSTRLNSSHVEISYAVFCLKKKKK